MQSSRLLLAAVLFAIPVALLLWLRDGETGAERSVAHEPPDHLASPQQAAGELVANETAIARERERRAAQQLETERGAELEELLQRRLTPAMRREINERLRPGGKPPQVRQGQFGSYIDLSDRAASVVVAVIDDDGNTVVTDFTQPLPVAEP